MNGNVSTIHIFSKDSSFDYNQSIVLLRLDSFIDGDLCQILKHK